MSNSETGKTEQKSDIDWGLNAPSQSQGGQIKIALLMIVTLVGALGYFVYRKYDERSAGMASAANFNSPDERQSPDGSGKPENADDAPDSTAMEYSSEPRAPGPETDALSPPLRESWPSTTASLAEDLPGNSSEPEVQLLPPQQETAEPLTTVPEQMTSLDREQPLDMFASREEPQAAPQQDWEQSVPAESEQTFDLFASREEPQPLPQQDSEQSGGPVESEQAFDLFAPLEESQSLPEQAPEESAPTESEQVFDLFAPSEEPPSSQTADPFESVDESAVDGSEHVNPFTFTPEGETVDTRQFDEAVNEPFPPASSEVEVPSWETGPPALPAIEPVAPADEPPGDEEPELIRVNSNEQFEVTSEEGAGFENPFFQPENSGPEEPSAPEPPPSRDAPEQPATLDFGIPVQPAPVGDPAPTPAIDWSPPAGDFPGESPSTPPTGSPFETGPATDAAVNRDPFVGAAIPFSNGTESSDDSAQLHTVRRGDSYWSIARGYYGAGRYFRALAAYNRSRIEDPDDLQPGMKVLVPEADLLEQRYPALLGESYVPREQAELLPAGFFMSRDGQPMYRVGKNDTLSSIAQAHLGRASRWRQIYGMNRDQLQNADHLQLGLELRLPADASQAELVSPPITFR